MNSDRTIAMDMPPATFWHSAAEAADLLRIDNESRALERLREGTRTDCLRRMKPGQRLLQIFQAAA
jgi:hypothetical protein